MRSGGLRGVASLVRLFGLTLLMSLTASAAQRQRNYLDMTWSDPPVPKAALTNEADYLRRKFRQDVTDPATGLSAESLVGELKKIVAAGKASGEEWRLVKARCFASQLDRGAIDLSPYDWFPAIAVWDRNSRPMNLIVGVRQEEINAARLSPEVRKTWLAGNADGHWTMWQDTDHSVPDWREILPLGFPGMRRRLDRYAGSEDPYYRALIMTADAMLHGIDRFVGQGERRLAGLAADERQERKDRLGKEIASLKRLREGAPRTAYDVLLFLWLAFMYEEHFDAYQCRSLTELDVTLTPYYRADLAAGRTTEAEFREQLRHFFWQWGSIANYWNHPIGLGGTRADGTSEYNEVSKIILDVADACALPTPKLLAKTAANTPDWAWTRMLDMARRHRSIAFLGEEPIGRALKILYPEATERDFREAVMWGCYEYALRDGANISLSFCPSLLKEVEDVFKAVASGRELPTFESFVEAYLAEVEKTTLRGLRICDEIEDLVVEINPANVMTVESEAAFSRRRDAFRNGCARGGDTGVRFCGLATAVDSLLAVKETVYAGDSRLGLAEFGRVLAKNWKGHEDLRLRLKRSPRKWGNNDSEANALGRRIASFCRDLLAGKRNRRGGRYFASGHTSRRYIDQAAKIGATPDGRKAGEEMSKNLSPTMGADTEGATALVNTLASVTVEEMPGDVPLDMMLHPSAVAGDSGPEVMKALVEAFHRNGGTVIQFTVFSAEELRDAQRHPEKYENLQVRVCGWNVRWNDIPKVEQDKFIARAAAIAQ